MGEIFAPGVGASKLVRVFRSSPPRPPDADNLPHHIIPAVAAPGVSEVHQEFLRGRAAYEIDARGLVTGQ